MVHLINNAVDQEEASPLDYTKNTLLKLGGLVPCSVYDALSLGCCYPDEGCATDEFICVQYGLGWYNAVVQGLLEEEFLHQTIQLTKHKFLDFLETGSSTNSGYGTGTDGDLYFIRQAVDKYNAELEQFTPTLNKNSFDPLSCCCELWQINDDRIYEAVQEAYRIVYPGENSTYWKGTISLEGIEIDVYLFREATLKRFGVYYNENEDCGYGSTILFHAKCKDTSTTGTSTSSSTSTLTGTSTATGTLEPLPYSEAKVIYRFQFNPLTYLWSHNLGIDIGTILLSQDYACERGDYTGTATSTSTSTSNPLFGTGLELISNEFHKFKQLLNRCHSENFPSLSPGISEGPVYYWKILNCSQVPPTGTGTTGTGSPTGTGTGTPTGTGSPTGTGTPPPPPTGTGTTGTGTTGTGSPTGTGTTGTGTTGTATATGTTGTATGTLTGTGTTGTATGTTGTGTTGTGTTGTGTICPDETCTWQVVEVDNGEYYTDQNGGTQQNTTGATIRVWSLILTNCEDVPNPCNCVYGDVGGITAYTTIERFNKMCPGDQISFNCYGDLVSWSGVEDCDTGTATGTTGTGTSTAPGCGGTCTYLIPPFGDFVWVFSSNDCDDPTCGCDTSQLPDLSQPNSYQRGDTITVPCTPAP